MQSPGGPLRWFPGPWRGHRALREKRSLLSRPASAVLCCLAAFAPPGAVGESDPLPHAFDAGWEGRQTCEVLYRGDAVRVGHCVFPPGVGHEKHYHNPHFGYVLTGGTLRISDSEGERTLTTRSGDRWSTTERTVHEAVNIGDTTTSYLIVEPLAN